MTTKQTFMLSVLAALALAVIACGGGGPTGPDPNPTPSQAPPPPLIVCDYRLSMLGDMRGGVRGGYTVTLSARAALKAKLSFVPNDAWVELYIALESPGVQCPLDGPCTGALEVTPTNAGVDRNVFPKEIMTKTELEPNRYIVVMRNRDSRTVDITGTVETCKIY